MVKDSQVRILMRLINREKRLETAAAKAGMSDKTARRYRHLGKLPSQCRAMHDWKTREDAFEGDWPWAQELLKNNAGLEAKTLFEALQREKPGKYQDGQLRTFQRRVRRWRALEGPGQEIFFAQVYQPGEWCESDFTHMESLGVTIGGVPFAHMLYHFVLCWSNWETGTVCFSESYESLSLGLQNALWKLGGVTKYHRTDNLTSAVNRVGNPEKFTEHYRGLANHYGFESCKIQPRLRQPRGLREVPGADVRAARCGPSGPTAGGTEGSASVAGATAPGLPGSRLSGGCFQYNSRAEEHVFSAQPAGGGMRDGSDLCRADRGLVRPAKG